MAGHRPTSMIFALANPSDPTTTAFVLLILLVLALFLWLLVRSSGRQGGTSTGSAALPVELGPLLLHRGRLDSTTQAIQGAFRAALPSDELILGRFDGGEIQTIIHAVHGESQPNRTYALPSAAVPFNVERMPAAKVLHKAAGDGSSRLATRLPVEGGQDALLIVRRDGQGFSSWEQQRFELLSQAVASALERLQLQSEVEDRVTQLVLLGEISRRLISLRPLEQRWSDVVPLLSQVFGFAHVEIFEQVAGSLMRSASHGAANPSNAVDPPAIVAEALAERATVFQSATNEPASSVRPTELSIPLMVERRLLGVLHLNRADGPAFSTEEIGLAEMLAGQLAIAALEAQHFTEQQEYTWYNTVLLEITRHAAQPGDPETALRSVLQLTTMLAGANWTLLLEPTEGAQALIASASSGLPRAASDQLTGLSVLTTDLGLTPPFQESDEPIPIQLPSALQEILGDEHCLGLLLSDGYELIGVLLVGGPEPAGPRRALLAGIGHQISLRIENNRLIDDLATRRSFERELETARNIQRSFLPDTFPQYPGWEVGATWQAARQVGGDFFDFIPLSDGENGPRWGLVIADVADKGVPAALFMALCRTLLRSVAIAHDDPAQVMTRLNQLIMADTRADLFVSLFYGVWQPGLRRIDFANGGHNPPLVVEPDGTFRSVERHGMVLGVSAKANYRTHQIELPEQGMFVLYTDGVPEAMNRQGQYFGMDQLGQLISQSEARSAQEVAETINEAVLTFCGSSDPPDDLTTVVLKHIATETPANSEEGD